MIDSDGYYLGLDPGKSGGLAVVNSKGHLCEAVGFKDQTDTDIKEWMLSYDFKMATLEDVHAYAHDGSRAAFSFGRSFGMVHGLLIGCGIPHDLIPPQKWQKEFSLLQRGKKISKTEKKNLNKAKAQQLFPGTKITHQTADAILIAYYTYKMERFK